MERFVLEKLNVVEGNLSKLYEPNGRYVAAVYSTDDYGNVMDGSQWARLGDNVSLRYVDEWEYYNQNTGEVYDEFPENEPYRMRAKTYRDIEYEITVIVTIPYSISYRYYSSDQYIMNDQAFISGTGTNAVMYYACDAADESNAEIEAFLRDFTAIAQPGYDYESKETYAAEFESFKGMFTMLGGVLCFIIGLVGMLNFLNAVLTGIITRRREFAVLQAIGMTGRQLKTMLIWEGIYYTLGSALVSFLLCLATAPLLSSALSGMFWFLSYEFTITPVLMTIPVFALLGTLLPLISYRFAEKQSIVERLRAIEG
jgi:putative ABC transport system permease protein